MLPATLQFLIVMIATAINDRLQRKLDYVEEERRVFREQLGATTGSKKLSFTAAPVQPATRDTRLPADMQYRHLGKVVAGSPRLRLRPAKLPASPATLPAAILAASRRIS
jgi:hypothetical protein